MSSTLTERTDEQMPTFSSAVPQQKTQSGSERITYRTQFVPNAAETDTEKRLSGAGDETWGAGAGEGEYSGAGRESNPADGDKMTDV